MLCVPLAGLLLLLSPPPDPSVSRMLEEARRTQEADIAAWRRFRFRRDVRKFSVRSRGEVLEEEMEFIVTPRGRGFDEQLVRIDGREPTPREVQQHRRLGRFDKHYGRLVRGERGRSYSLDLLLKMGSYRYAGPEVRAGIPCHRLEFAPAPSGFDGVAGRFAQNMEGRLWITAEGGHILAAETWSLRPISLFFPVARLSDLKVHVLCRQAAPDVWLPAQVEVWARGWFLFVNLNRHTIYTYSDFVPVRREREALERRSGRPRAGGSSPRSGSAGSELRP